LTPEAASEVGPGVGGGMEVVTERAEEAQMVLGVFKRDFKDGGNECVDGDVVSQTPQVCRRKTLRYHSS